MRLGFSEQIVNLQSFQIHPPTRAHGHPYPLPHSCHIQSPLHSLSSAAMPHPTPMRSIHIACPFRSRARRRRLGPSLPPSSAAPSAPALRPAFREPSETPRALQWRVVSPRGQSALSGAWSVQSTQWRVVHWPPGAYWLWSPTLPLPANEAKGAAPPQPCMSWLRSGLGVRGRGRG